MTTRSATSRSCPGSRHSAGRRTYLKRPHRAPQIPGRSCESPRPPRRPAQRTWRPQHTASTGTPRRRRMVGRLLVAAPDIVAAEGGDGRRRARKVMEPARAVSQRRRRARGHRPCPPCCSLTDGFQQGVRHRWLKKSPKYRADSTFLPALLAPPILQLKYAPHALGLVPVVWLQARRQAGHAQRPGARWWTGGPSCGSAKAAETAGRSWERPRGSQVAAWRKLLGAHSTHGAAVGKSFERSLRRWASCRQANRAENAEVDGGHADRSLAGEMHRR